MWTLPDHYVLGADSGIAVARDGSIWVGVDMALIHLNPATGAIATFAVPTPSDSLAAEGYRPEAVRGQHDIRAIAVWGSEVAIAISASAQMVAFDGHGFKEWMLPSNTDPLDVAYLDDGTLGVSLNDYATHQVDKISTFTPTGVRTDSSTVSAWDLASVGTTFVTLTRQVTTVNSRGQVSGAANLASSSDASAVQPVSVRPIGILPDGDVIAASTNGVMAVNRVTGETSDVRLPLVSCLPPTASIPVGYTPSASKDCPQIPILLTPDASGDVWLLLPDAPQEVAELTDFAS